MQQCILLILLKSAGWNYPKRSLNYRSLPIKKMPISLLDGNIIGIKQAFSEYFEMPGCNTCKDPIVYFPPFYWYLEVMARAIEVQLQGMTSWWSNDCTKIAPPQYRVIRLQKVRKLKWFLCTVSVIKLFLSNGTPC